MVRNLAGVDSLLRKNVKKNVFRMLRTMFTSRRTNGGRRGSYSGPATTSTAATGTRNHRISQKQHQIVSSEYRPCPKNVVSILTTVEDHLLTIKNSRHRKLANKPRDDRRNRGCFLLFPVPLHSSWWRWRQQWPVSIPLPLPRLRRRRESSSRRGIPSLSVPFPRG
jgi:hypothetical protein